VISLSALQLLQMNDWLALSRLPLTPLYHLWIHFLQLWHKIELLPTLFLRTMQGHLPFSSILSFILQLNIIFIFPVYILEPLASKVYNLHSDEKAVLRFGWLPHHSVCLGQTGLPTRYYRLYPAHFFCVPHIE